MTPNGRVREFGALPGSCHSGYILPAVETAGKLMLGKAFWLAKDHRLRPSTRLETIMESNASSVHREP